MENEERIRKWRGTRDAAAGTQPGAATAETRAHSEAPAQARPHAPSVALEDMRLAILERRSIRLRDIVRRLMIYVATPVLAVLLYVVLVATPLYEGEAVFTVQTSTNSASSPSAGMFAIAGANSTISDAFKAREFILSRPMMEHMQERYGFLDHFASVEMDPITRYRNALGYNRDPFDYYLKRVAVGVDVQEGILRLSVEARTKQDAIRFGNGILAAAEQHVNNSSDKIGTDQIAALTRDVQQAEMQVATSRRSLASVQARRGDLSPEQTTTAVYQLISSLELQLAETDRQRNALMSEGLTNSPLLPSLESRSRELRSQIAAQRNRLVNPGGGSIARTVNEYEGALSRKEIAQARWESTLNTLQQAYLQVLQQRRYFVIVVGMSAGAFASVRDLIMIAVPILLLMALLYALFFIVRRARRDGGGPRFPSLSGIGRSWRER